MRARLGLWFLTFAGGGLCFLTAKTSTMYPFTSNTATKNQSFQKTSLAAYSLALCFGIPTHLGSLPLILPTTASPKRRGIGASRASWSYGSYGPSHTTSLAITLRLVKKPI